MPTHPTGLRLSIRLFQPERSVPWRVDLSFIESLTAFCLRSKYFPYLVV